jgi:hypothetical protein
MRRLSFLVSSLMRVARLIFGWLFEMNASLVFEIN